MPAWAYKVHRCADERNNGKVIARLTQGDATGFDQAVKLARRAF